MLKKIMYHITFLIALSPLISYANSEKKYTPKNTIFLWDIHGVILQRDNQKVWNIFWNYPRKWKAITHTNFRLFTELLKLIGRAIIGESPSELFLHSAKVENNDHIAEWIKQFANAQKPIKESVAIIKQLRKMGYPQEIGSNIGENVFNDLINPQKNPELAPIFLKNFNLNNPHIVSFNDGNLIRKPSKEYFENYLKKNNIDLQKITVIFIDDIKENVDAANAVGLYGIHFISPEQLRLDLQKLGIALKENRLSKKQNFGLAV